MSNPLYIGKYKYKCLYCGNLCDIYEPCYSCGPILKDYKKVLETISKLRPRDKAIKFNEVQMLAKEVLKKHE